MRSAHVVVGMGYGDEGKGTIVDYLVRREKADLVVRFNGGPQAGHNVVVPGFVEVEDNGPEPMGRISRPPIHHEFRQFGSGTFAGARTHLSRFCVVNPEMLFLEADHLIEKKISPFPLSMVSVDELCPIITPFHVAANRTREVARGSARHGSCGMGIWETEKERRDPDIRHLTAGDLTTLDDGQLRKALRDIRDRKRAEITPLVKDIPGAWAHNVLRDLQDNVSIPVLAETYRIFGEVVEITDGLPDFETAVFEGAQGILLDENLGFHPYTTGSTTTSKNALALCVENVCPNVRVIGATRAYATRHGAGPFPTETDLTIPEPHNDTGQWQGGWRQGWTDLVALRYASDCDPHINALAVTHVDSVASELELTWPVADRYDGMGWDKIPLVPRNRLQQERLTKFMFNARPQYAQVEPEMVSQSISQFTGLPIDILSHGPTYHDKEDLASAVSG